MKTFDFYEFAALLTPGAVLLIGLTLLLPGLAPSVNAKDTTFGDLGVFVVLSYAIGHVTQALGAILEPRVWALTGGGVRPTDWVRTGRGRLLAPSQHETLKEHIQPKLGLAQAVDIDKIDKRAWDDVVRQIYAAVEASGHTTRIDIFNGTYGLCRGIATSVFVLLLAFIASGVGVALKGHGVAATLPQDVALGLGLVIVEGLLLHRMQRFGRYYARELFVQFLQLPLPDATGQTNDKATGMQKPKGHVP